MNNCVNCNKETNNPRFCSRSCAAKTTNKESVKRQLTRVCVKCDSIVVNCRTTFCKQHFKEHQDNKVNYQSLTLGEYQSKPSVKDKHPSWINAHVRGFNRSWNKDLTKQSCEVCGYTKHVELCHIKPVRDFDSHATLGEINHPTNMRVLCPNHHWEFDNGLL